MDSILLSTKKSLGLGSSYEAFDPEIIMHINSALFDANQIGIGPAEVGQQRVARAIDLDLADELQLRSIGPLRRRLGRFRNRPHYRFAAAHDPKPISIRRFCPGHRPAASIAISSGSPAPDTHHMGP